MRIDSGWGEFLGHQAAVFRHVRDGQRMTRTAALGGWGSGKSEGVVRAALAHAIRNPYRPEYGETRPTTVVMGPTSKVVNTSTRRSFQKAVPRAIVAKAYKTSPYEVILKNGHSIVFWSADAEFEGASLTGVVVDEIAHRSYQEQDKWMNIVSRVRDPLAPKLTILVAGLPEQGWVREHFDYKANDPTGLTVLSGMMDNLYLPAETVANYRSDCPAGQEDFFLYGRWRMPEHAIYSRFSSDVHVVSDELRPGVLTHASFDFGDRSHILIGQTYTEGGEKRLLVGDEIHLEGVDTPGQARALRELANKRGLVFGAGSTFNMDPTAKIEQIKPVRDAFPGVRVVQTQRGNAYFEIDDGIRCVQRAIMDSMGVIRVRFSRSLMNRRYGVIDGIQSYRRNPQTQVPVRDNLRDHALDTFRYMVCEHLPESRVGFGVIK